MPVAHLLALVHAGTGVLRTGRAAPWHPHDMAQVAALQALLSPGDGLVGARVFCSLAPLALWPQQGLQAGLPHIPSD